MMQWQFIDWSFVWNFPRKVVLVAGLSLALLLNSAIALLCTDWFQSQHQQLEIERMNIELQRAKLLQQLQTFISQSVDFTAEYSQLLRLYPEHFSSSEFYTYIAPRLAKGLEIEAWQWGIDNNHYSLSIVLNGRFEQFRQFIGDALDYYAASRVDKVNIELSEVGLNAHLELSFFVRESEHEK